MLWSPVTRRNIARARVGRLWPAPGSDPGGDIDTLHELHPARMMLPARSVDRAMFRPARRLATPARVI